MPAVLLSFFGSALTGLRRHSAVSSDFSRYPLQNPAFCQRIFQKAGIAVRMNIYKSGSKITIFLRRPSSPLPASPLDRSGKSLQSFRLLPRRPRYHGRASVNNPAISNQNIIHGQLLLIFALLLFLLFIYCCSSRFSFISKSFHKPIPITGTTRPISAVFGSSTSVFTINAKEKHNRDYYRHRIAPCFIWALHIRELLRYTTTAAITSTLYNIPANTTRDVSSSRLLSITRIQEITAWKSELPAVHRICSALRDS